MNSKALEAFDYITTFSVKGEKICIQDIDKYQVNCDIVENALKALEIIKKKNVKIDVLKYQSAVVFYNMAVFDEEEELTQEEWDLLKGVLL